MCALRQDVLSAGIISLQEPAIDVGNLSVVIVAFDLMK